jgi:hypothetical protein
MLFGIGQQLQPGDGFFRIGDNAFGKRSKVSGHTADGRLVKKIRVVFKKYLVCGGCLDHLEG